MAQISRAQNISMLHVSQPFASLQPFVQDSWALPERPYSYIALVDLAKKRMPGSAQICRRSCAAR
ncbi:MAG: hypothetical protein P8N94_07650 [Gammaproteobacteria bacterium]|nr:hypothetical protein [Gammaproteobacteria bacterium]MDG2337850.1 hypothetical protein [Gammaproteobacteria bacterium]